MSLWLCWQATWRARRLTSTGFVNWVFGKYTLQLGKGNENPVIQVDASIGLAEWRTGKSLQDLISEADAGMYKDKNHSRKAR